jgi:hypothetical protein
MSAAARAVTPPAISMESTWSSIPSEWRKLKRKSNHKDWYSRTGPEPARSMMPLFHKGSFENAERKPFWLQKAWATTGYAKPARKTEYNRYAFIWVRSAMVPATMDESAQVKANWKNQNARSTSVFCRKKPVLPTNDLSPSALSPP